MIIDVSGQQYEIALGSGMGLCVKNWSDGTVKVGVEEERIHDGVKMPPGFIILGSGVDFNDALKDLLKRPESVDVGVKHKIPICLQRALDMRRGHPRGRVTQEAMKINRDRESNKDFLNRITGAT